MDGIHWIPYCTKPSYYPLIIHLSLDSIHCTYRSSMDSLAPRRDEPSQSPCPTVTAIRAAWQAVRTAERGPWISSSPWRFSSWFKHQKLWMGFHHSRYCHDNDNNVVNPTIIPNITIINNSLVVDLPLWKIWVIQLGWWHSQLNGKIKNVPNHQSA